MFQFGPGRLVASLLLLTKIINIYPRTKILRLDAEGVFWNKLRIWEYPLYWNSKRRV